MVKRFGFPKKQRLKSRKLIEEVFTGGKTVTAFPLRASYLYTKGNGLLQVGVTASKRNFKKAVDRNRIKRLIREAYRLQQHTLLFPLQEKQVNGAVFFMYTDRTIAPFQVIQEAMEQCLKKLEQKIPNEDHS